MNDGIVERGSFDLALFADELTEARGNLAVGNALWFENHRIKVWEVKLRSGERGAFHAHTRDYLWTVVEEGRGLQRFPDGTYTVREYRVGDTSYTEHTPDDPLIHDLENVGDTDLRFVTVELLE